MPTPRSALPSPLPIPWLAVLAALAVCSSSLPGCESSDGADAPSPVATPGPSSATGFVLTTSVPKVRLPAGKTVDVTVGVQRSGYTGDVRLEVNGLPEGVTAVGTREPMTANEPTRTITLRARISAPAVNDVQVHIGGLGDALSGQLTAVDVATTVVPMVGLLDSSFADAGRALLATPGVDDGARCMRVLPDGKIVIAGTQNEKGANPDWFVARLAADGSVDSSFGKAGIATVDFANRADRLVGCEVLADGKILLAGTATFFRGIAAQLPDQDFALARLDANGALDPQFGQGGKLDLDMGTRYDEAGALAVRGTRVVVAGRIDPDPAQAKVQRIALVSLTTSGALDGAFGDVGRATFTWGADREMATAAAIDEAGNVVVAGSTATGTDGRMAVSKVSPAGLQDAAYGVAGGAYADFGGLADRATSLALGGDGSVLVAGEAPNADGSSDLALARFTPAGLADAAFGTGGTMRALQRKGARTSANAVRLVGDVAYVASSRTWVLGFQCNGHEAEGFSCDGHEAEGFSCNGITDTGAVVLVDARTGALDPRTVETGPAFLSLGGVAGFADLHVGTDALLVAGFFAAAPGGERDAAVAKLRLPR